MSVIKLEGTSRHGKNRIAQHGSVWFVEKVDKFLGQPAMLLRSKNETFKCGNRWMHDGRWVLLKNDPNFVWS